MAGLATEYTKQREHQPTPHSMDHMQKTEQTNSGSNVNMTIERVDSRRSLRVCKCLPTAIDRDALCVTALGEEGNDGVVKWQVCRSIHQNVLVPPAVL